MRTINYSPKPSPLHSPPVPLSVLDGDHHMRLHLAPIILIVITGTTCIVMFLFLFTLFKILRYYRYRYNFTKSNQPILFDIRGDFPFSDDEEHGEAAATRPHPVWFIAAASAAASAASAAAAAAAAAATEEGLQQSIIDSITVCEYRKDDEGTLVKETECLVCLGEFQQEESLRVLPKCNHAFHVPCIDTWLRSHKSCPLCRAAIVLDVVASVESDSSVSDMNELYIEESGESGGVRVVGDEEDDDSSVRIYPSFQDK